jgi:inhibitor of KinA sporulation pathway (predicted exonuclease)
MAKILDKILIVDVEATCWNGKVPDGMDNEIIEIGVCLLDIYSGEVTNDKGIIVKPQKSVISPFCTELTTITQEMVDSEGISFKDACNILRKEYCSQSRPWASFGAYDYNQFQKQCSLNGIPYPFGASHINVKTLFALKRKLVREQGMVGALAILEIPLEGTHHRGVDDAKNIAKIMRWILNN